MLVGLKYRGYLNELTYLCGRIIKKKRMKYLLVSDIHGCLPALEKVLQFYDREHCDMLCILGDILTVHATLFQRESMQKESLKH